MTIQEKAEKYDKLFEDLEIEEVCEDCDGTGGIPTLPDGEPEMHSKCCATGKISRPLTDEEKGEVIGAIPNLIECFEDNCAKFRLKSGKRVEVRQ